jgi:hypothetical protein
MAAALGAGQPQARLIPITEADSVLAVYREDWGRAAAGTPAIILAAWPDGRMVWSEERLRGGAPYRAGRVDRRKVAALLERFDRDGVFSDEKLNEAHFGPDSQFISLFIKSGAKKVKMQSWHELFEASGGLVVTSTGASSLNGPRRLEEPADYLVFRLIWSETRALLAGLVPSESREHSGTPFMKGGILSWREPAGLR